MLPKRSPGSWGSTMVEPYYQDEFVTLYHGDCREITEWLAADVLVTDPPYGRAWRQGELKRSKSRSHAGITNDSSTDVRDAVLEMWGGRLAVVFGDLMLAPPPNVRQVAIYRKPPDSGTRGATAGRRRDVEAIYLLGPWPSGIGGATSVFTSGARMQGGQFGAPARYGHPHAKPLDVMAELIKLEPAGKVADPCSGSGSTLVAAKLLGRRAIGVELEEPYCERTAERLSIPDLLSAPTTPGGGQTPQSSDQSGGAA